MSGVYAKVGLSITKIKPRSHWKEVLAALMLLIAFMFFRNERKELAAIVPQLNSASGAGLLAGVVITLIYVFCQAGIYRRAFSAVQLRLPWQDACILFLKRNFIGVFMPAGGVSSLAYFPTQLRRHGFDQSKVYQASGLFGFAGMLTVFIAGFPVVAYTVVSTSKFKDSWIGLAAILIIIILLFAVYRSLKNRGKAFRLIDKHFPSVSALVEKLVSAKVDSRKFGSAVAFSLGVELTGMATVYICMVAIGVQESFAAAAAAYIIAVIMMVISPFLRGLGAVEVSMVYVLGEFGYSAADSLSVTILFRVFEFWLPLLAGLISFAWRGRQLFLRAAPVLLIFLSGIVNVISALTTPLQPRMKLLRQYLPLDAIHASNILVLFFGLALLITSAYLIRGLKNAWRVAIIITVLSLVGNLTKALDYEEATLCLVTLIILLSTASQYRINSSKEKMRSGMVTSLLIFVAVLVFGFVSFYYISPRHFGKDFSWQQSLIHTFRSFLLVEDPTIVPRTRFGREFSMIVRGLGFFTWIYLLISLIRTNKHQVKQDEDSVGRARSLLEQHGNSAVDYFKVYEDKLIFISEVFDGFISYKVSGNFAIVLEGPVCAVEDKLDILREFQSHCYRMGLRPAFYRVDESNLLLFETLKKQKLIIGQEAIVDTKIFSLEGKDRKSLRNGLNSLQKNGFITIVHKAPHKTMFMEKLRSVSDEWLQDFDKTESVFSQGMFLPEELMKQDIITVEDEHGNVKAFLNIIPDYAPGECTYDLIRKTPDAPGAAMDALIVKLIEYAKTHGKSFLNMGMVPIAGIQEVEGAAEKIIKVAGEKLKRFQHYKGLRFFKEKYATIWENKYLIYENDFDLVQLSIALNNVMKPLEE